MCFVCGLALRRPREHAREDAFTDPGNLAGRSLSSDPFDFNLRVYRKEPAKGAGRRVPSLVAEHL